MIRGVRMPSVAGSVGRSAVEPDGLPVDGLQPGREPPIPVVSTADGAPVAWSGFGVGPVPLGIELPVVPLTLGAPAVPDGPAPLAVPPVPCASTSAVLPARSKAVTMVR